MLFEEMDLKPRLAQNLAAMGYKEPTPIQEKTFALVMAGGDIMALAETGSGKTSACGIPIVQKIDPAIRTIQALILVPTRELAQQYIDEIFRLSEGMGIECFSVFGGFSMSIQKAKLNHGVHILVATPGRLIDHLYNSELTLSSLRTLILDEADVMLDMGFIDDIKFVKSCIVAEHQTLMFSATMPHAIAALADKCLKNPDRIELNRDRIAPQSLKHYFQYLAPHDRDSRMLELLKDPEVAQAIVFCNSRDNGEKLFRTLRPNCNNLEYIHGGLSQDRRTSLFNRFKQGKIRVLLATDVAGRGLDFSHVTHVFNYDFPQTSEAYTHRTGRTGRMGRKGTACTLVTRRDLGKLNHLLHSNSLDANWIGEPPAEGEEHQPTAHHRPHQDHRRPRQPRNTH